MKLSVNLAEKMISGRKKLDKKTELAVNEANKLIQALNDEDRQVLRDLSLDHNIHQASWVRNIDHNLSKFETGRIFHIDAIEKICHQYNLRFLKTRYYKGHVDPLLATKIKDFEYQYCASKRESWKEISQPTYENKSFLSDSQVANGYCCHYFEEDGKYYACRYDRSSMSYHIMAPKESFELEERPVDPLVFAPIGDGNYWYLVHQWGDDLSLFRRMQGMFPVGPFFEDGWSMIGLLCLGIGAALVAALLVVVGTVAMIPLGLMTDAEREVMPMAPYIAILWVPIMTIATVLIGSRLQKDQWNSPFND